MLVKSLEFKNSAGQKVIITEIPVLNKSSPHYFMIQVRLHGFIKKIQAVESNKNSFSFREYMKSVLKWPVYRQIFKTPDLKNNA
ncbi:hypothetical protein J2Z40_001809 [Cytobacillus eiseniae]|uniref:DUF2535 domain-containing protein n=1 Tax=Cytobacillus eiseniae TaxID=762947 RepID=A0ABS4RHD5_9BACI|nr:DUF2535 family protein [Cytobacillus eiseniae]MBP2241247.1 hypothetical protein [Cytobacillus eiseniae]